MLKTCIRCRHILLYSSFHTVEFISHAFYTFCIKDGRPHPRSSTFLHCKYATSAFSSISVSFCITIKNKRSAIVGFRHLIQYSIPSFLRSFLWFPRSLQMCKIDSSLAGNPRCFTSVHACRMCQKTPREALHVSDSLVRSTILSIIPLNCLGIHNKLLKC